jgi:hypothetical protein
MYYYYAQTNFSETYTNDFSVTRLGRAIDVIDDPRTAGVDPICRSVLDGTDPQCVPWDIFATGQVSQAALNYLQTPGFQRGTNKQTVASASLAGNLGGWGIQLPWANEGIGVALGVEYRKESLELLTDAAERHRIGHRGEHVTVDGTQRVVIESSVNTAHLRQLASRRRGAFPVGRETRSRTTAPGGRTCSGPPPRHARRRRRLWQLHESRAGPHGAAAVLHAQPGAGVLHLRVFARQPRVRLARRRVPHARPVPLTGAPHATGIT